MSLDKVKQKFYCMRRPRNIADALKCLVSPRMVDNLRGEVPMHYLIETIATEAGRDPRALLRETGEALGIGSVISLPVPRREFLQELGYDAETLESLFALPYECPELPCRYVMIVADPTVLDQEMFEAQGVKVALGLGSDIAEVWKKHRWSRKQHAKTLGVGQLFAILKQLAVDSERCGAKEVFIGHPDELSYEFLARGKRFSGRLHAEMYPMLLEQFQTSYRISREIPDAPPLRSLNIALTRSFERPVVCLTWEVQVERRAEEVDTAPQTKPAQPPKAEAVVQRPVSNVPKRQDGERHVLLVDDDERFLLILSKIMEGKGWRVSKQPNGDRALQVLKSGDVDPDLIVSDVHMPHMDGAAFLKQLRKAGLAKPVLMLTSDDDGLLEAELALMGADAFVRKQEDPRVLLAWCNNLVSRAVNAEPSPMHPQNGAHAVNH